MNYIQKFQKFFHTDKWWGKFLLILIIYAVYIVLGYILVPLIFSILQGNNFGGILTFIFIFFIIPILSFYIPSLILKIFNINKIFLYIFHTLLIIIIPFVFMWIIIFFAFSNFSIG